MFFRFAAIVAVVTSLPTRTVGVGRLHLRSYHLTDLGTFGGGGQLTAA